MTSPTPGTTPAPEQTPTATTTPAPTPAPVQFTPEQEAEINRRAAAARKEGETAGKTAAETAIADAKRLADEEAERKRKIDAGEFETVRTDLEGKLTAATAERDDYRKRYENAVAQIEPGVTAKWKDLPAEVTKLYRGADDDVIAKSAFVTESEPLIAALTGKAGPGTGKVWPNTPRPNGTTEQAAQTEAQRLAASGKYGKL